MGTNNYKNGLRQGNAVGHKIEALDDGPAYTRNGAQSKARSNGFSRKNRFEDWLIADAARALGGDVQSDDSILCPGPGHKPGDKSLHVTRVETHRDGFILCSFSGDDADECRAHVSEVLGLSDAPPSPLSPEQLAEREVRRKAQEAQERAKKAAAIASAGRMWDEAYPAHSNHTARDYFSNRGLDVSLCEDRLRWQYTAGSYSNIIAKIEGPDGETKGFQFTYLNGSIKTDKFGGGGRRTEGYSKGIIRLTENPDLGVLAVGEGVETALSFTQLRETRDVTIWATVTCANLAAFPVLDDFDEVIVAVDVEESGAGEKAAEKLKDRWLAAGKRVVLVYPILGAGETKRDLNDVIQVDGGPIEGVHYSWNVYEGSAGGDTCDDEGDAVEGEEPDPTNRPIITLHPDRFSENVDQAEDALIAGGEHYQRGKDIVIIGDTPVIVNDRHEKAGQRIYPVGDYALVKALNLVARFEKLDGRSKKYVAVEPPLDIAKTLRQLEGQRRLPILTSVLDRPTITSDGRLLTKPGYDPASGLFLDFKRADFPEIPDRPTREDALEALGALKGLVPDFPFVTPADKSVFLSAALTSVSRTACPTSPGFGFTAPTPRTGKSKLVDVVHMIANGKQASVITMGLKTEEFEKRLDGELLAGVTNIAIDNISCPVDSAQLCAALTQAVVKPRVLGVSKNPEVSNVALITLTGNNLVVVGDLTQRILKCSLDAQCERPELRKFDSVDPVTQIRVNRGRFVAHCLTVLRAFIVAGRPITPSTPFGGLKSGVTG